MERKEDNINISFLPVAPDTVSVQLGQVEVACSDITPPISSDKPAFGHRPNTKLQILILRQRSITCLLN